MYNSLFSGQMKRSQLVRRDVFFFFLFKLYETNLNCFGSITEEDNVFMYCVHNEDEKEICLTQVEAR